MKATKKAKPETGRKSKATKLTKGSTAAKRHMAKLRSLRGKR